jgi:starch phosphorylase
MEIALEDAIPTYSGGLGVLAGDTLRAAADLQVAMVAITLVHRKGYFRQRLDADGNQIEDEASWQPEDRLERLDSNISIRLADRDIAICAWRFRIHGVSPHPIDVFLLDTDLPENSTWDRSITDHLYGGDEHYRLCQEAVLGMGGIALLESLGYTNITTYHMNEGHSAFLTLALLDRQTKGEIERATEQDIEAVRRRCVFTTHTPVPAGHDQFPRDAVSRVLGDRLVRVLHITNCCPSNLLNMTFLALRFSRYINGVAMRHGEVSRDMFPRYPIRAITNGVHAVTWTSEPFRRLLDRHIPEWRSDNQYLRYAVGIPLKEIRAAHEQAKADMISELERRAAVKFDQQVLTIGFARRATPYKRADLLISDLGRLRALAERNGPIQVVYGGKAHPRDNDGKAMIRRIIEASHVSVPVLRIAYVEDYDIRWARSLTSGVDLWLNTPHRPHEASGTSGMKAALNGVPSLSVLDGWWIEGCVEGVTGWAIGRNHDATSLSEENASLYEKLEKQIVPLYYERREAFDEIRRAALSLNGSFFNTQRMLSQYLANAYVGPALAESEIDRASQAATPDFAARKT